MEPESICTNTELRSVLEKNEGKLMLLPEESEYCFVIEKTRQRHGYDATTTEGVANTHKKALELLMQLEKQYPEDTFTVFKFKSNSTECEDSYGG